MSAEWEIQSAIYTALTGDATLMALIQGVYDDVPQSAASETSSDFPFVVIGEDDFISWDTDTETGHEGTLNIHVWSRYRGKYETKQIFGAIYNALNRQDLTLTNFWLIDIQYDSSDSFVDPDGFTRHGVIKFLVKLEGK